MYTRYDREEPMNNPPSIGSTYSKIIELTYYGDSRMFEDLESHIENKVSPCAFNKNLLITINRFDRLDTTIPLIRGQFDTTDYVVKSDNLFQAVSTADTTDRNKGFEMSVENLNRLVEHDLDRMVDHIVEIDNDPIRISTVRKSSRSVRRVGISHLNEITTDGRVDLTKLNSYSKQIVERFSSFDLNRGTVDIFVELWSLSLILPLHNWILRAIIGDQERENILYILGEYDKTELEFMCFGPDSEDIPRYITEEYPSHSMLFVLTDRLVYPYDPDDPTPIRSDTFLGKTVLRNSISPPIQSVTDDINCIFHSLFAMIDMVEIQSTDNISDLNI
jgi:hypothetical protein